jgi:two-component system C4-dicarboxylate transport response regulator DctD
MPDQPAASFQTVPTRILVVEDDEQFRHSVKRALELDGHQVSPFADAESALEGLAAVAPTVILTDLRLPFSDGLYLLDRVREKAPDLPVVLMTGHGDIPTAIQAIRAGVYDFLEKPFSRERLLAVIQRASDQHRLVKENQQLKLRLAAASGIDQVVRGDSPPVRELRDLILRLAPKPVDVLIRGETGTGKELVARCLHDYGNRTGNFVAVNCAAVPEHLFESELFGHEAGAFTGATKVRIGKIEHAKDGTLFLDEVEAMPLALQAKVLRVLQEREVERLGSNRPIPVNFRVVAATKVSLAELGSKGGFREDLFYRLNVAMLKVPPLHERPGDILGLFQVFLQQASLRYQMPMPTVGAEHHQALLSSRWPGNVRELKACAERCVLGMPMFVDGNAEAAASLTFDESMSMIERSLLEASLRRHAGSVKAVCVELSLTPATIYRKLKALGLDAASFKVAGGDQV